MAAHEPAGLDAQPGSRARALAHARAANAAAAPPDAPATAAHVVELLDAATEV
jgi:hypothetical protein